MLPPPPPLSLPIDRPASNSLGVVRRQTAAAAAAAAAAALVRPDRVAIVS
jgi:hypothetical protein